MKHQFISKPVVVEARKVEFENDMKSIWEWMGDSYLGHSESEGLTIYVSVATNHGVARAEHGDWIIKNQTGECYPCKPDIFAAKYEPQKAPQKLETHKYEVFGFINEQNVLMPEASRDRISLEGLPKGKLSRVMIQVVAET